MQERLVTVSFLHLDQFGHAFRAMEAGCVLLSTAQF